MVRPVSRYIHGTAPVEQRRLARLNDLLNTEALREIDLRGGERILDLGCGPGQLTVAMARAAGPAGRVLGLERDSAQIRAAQRLVSESGFGRRVKIRRGDALAPPLRKREWGGFDLAHARFLLEHVPDPLAVVRALVRAVRPGGRIVLQDDDHDLLRLWPEPPGLMPVWQAYIRTYDRNGNDPYIGRRLVALLHQAGAVPKRNTWIFFGACAGSPKFAALTSNLARILEGARDAILSGGLLDAASCKAGLASLRAWQRRPDAALWFALAYAEAERR